MSAVIKLPLDLQSFVSIGIKEHELDFFWPSSPEEYDTIAEGNLQLLLNIADESCDSDKKLMYLKFRDLFTDFNYLVSDSLDVQKALSAGYSPFCSKDSFAYKNILAETPPPMPISLARMRAPIVRRLKDKVKRMLWQKPGPPESGSKLYFTNGVGELGQIWMKNKKISPIQIANNLFSVPPKFRRSAEDTKPLAAKVHSGWLNITKSVGLKISAMLSEHLLKLAKYHLSWALRDLHSPAPFPLGNTTYLSGTGGSYWNRLISCKTQQAGGKVIRFDHGGERPFHSDKWWGINEFVFCDQFITFSEHGAGTIKKKITENNLITLLESPGKLTVSHAISGNFSRLTGKYSAEPPREIKTIMFVPTGFQGECNSTPSFTNHDIPYADFQFQILDALTIIKTNILYKEAPKVPIGRLFDPSCLGAQRITGFLSDCLGMADAFIFTFVGTAFCEALCTNMPVILLQAPPSRPMSAGEKNDLSQVCRIVPCSISSKNRLILDRQKLLESIVPMTDQEILRRNVFRHKWLL